MTGVLDWQGLSIGDPRSDLHWTAGAPDAADDVFRSYTDDAVRAPDRALRVRARLHAELEFAKWLLHGIETHRSDVVDDAAELLESLSAGLADDALLADLPAQERADVSEAVALLDRVPRASQAASDTSMHTDAFDPDELRLHADEVWDSAPPRPASDDGDATQPSIDLPPTQRDPRRTRTRRGAGRGSG